MLSLITCWFIWFFYPSQTTGFTLCKGSTRECTHCWRTIRTISRQPCQQGLTSITSLKKLANLLDPNQTSLLYSWPQWAHPCVRGHPKAFIPVWRTLLGSIGFQTEHLSRFLSVSPQHWVSPQQLCAWAPAWTPMWGSTWFPMFLQRGQGAPWGQGPCLKPMFGFVPASAMMPRTLFLGMWSLDLLY